jgi:TRAP-type transport system periplasmic protein
MTATQRGGWNLGRDKMKKIKYLLKLTTVAALTSLAALSAQADMVLKASHQFPGGKGDIRDEMVQLIAREVAAANVGLSIQVFPGSSLYKPNDQWNALTRGLLDMTSFPLDYASGRIPEFSATLMPGLVGNFDRAKRLNSSPFMTHIKKIIDKQGAIVISDAWLSGAFASKKSCITAPETVKGQVIRAAGPAFEEMLVGAGASISSMPSSEIYTGMQTGVLDAANTSSASFVSYRLFEQAKCLTAPGENALWFMYEPVMISKKTFAKLTPEQQKAILAAGKKAEDFFDAEVRKGDQVMIDAYKKAGVEVVEMTKQDYDAWLEIAKKTSYKNFSAKVPDGAKLIDEALAVK